LTVIGTPLSGRVGDRLAVSRVGLLQRLFRTQFDHRVDLAVEGVDLGEHELSQLPR
jgi:hypothetical protein